MAGHIPPIGAPMESGSCICQRVPPATSCGQGDKTDSIMVFTSAIIRLGNVRFRLSGGTDEEEKK
jgi:hypothetical protein